MSPLTFLLLTFIRLTLNTAHRMVYPFLNVFARSVGVEWTALAALVANRALFAAGASFAFPFIEIRGRRFGMMVGLGFFLVGMATVTWSPTLPALGVALVCAVLAKGFFDPSLLAYLADHSPYHQRGWYTALSEMAWSSSFILGVPAMAWVMNRFGWRSPFMVLGLLGMVGVLLVARLVSSNQTIEPHREGGWGHLRDVLTDRMVLAALSIGLFASLANEVVSVTFGVWLEQAFGVKLATLAAAALVIGLSELGGEGSVAIFADRLGKVRAAGLGLLANGLTAILLPWVGSTVPGALIGLFLFYISFEFTIVSQIPLMSEVMPRARATTLAFNAAGQSLGRAVGALLGPWLYTLFGFGAVTVAVVMINLLSLLAVKYVSAYHS